MKKILPLLLCVVLAGCMEQPLSSNPHADNIPVQTEIGVSQEQIELRMLTPIDGALESSATGNDYGYYDLLYQPDGGANITYIDFSSAIYTYLNSEITAANDAPENRSWLPYGAFSLFYLNKKLYCVKPDDTTNTPGAIQIVAMEPNGDAQKVVVHLQPNQSLTRGIATDGVDLYTTIDTASPDGKIRTTLSRISISSGTIEDIIELPMGNLLYGVYKDKFYFKIIGTDITNVGKEPWVIYAYSLTTHEKETILTETPYTSIGGIYQGGYYHLDTSDKVLYKTDLDTAKTEVIAEKIPLSGLEGNASFLGVFDDHFLFVEFVTDPSGNLSYAVYGIDLKTRELPQVTLMCNYRGERYVWVRWETPEYFLVINGEKTFTGTFYAPDGTTYQEELVTPSFALIRKQDYWNSIPNYIEIDASLITS